jgi:hypothetical protein
MVLLSNGSTWLWLLAVRDKTHRLGGEEVHFGIQEAVASAHLCDEHVVLLALDMTVEFKQSKKPACTKKISVFCGNAISSGSVECRKKKTNQESSGSAILVCTAEHYVDVEHAQFFGG